MPVPIKIRDNTSTVPVKSDCNTKEKYLENKIDKEIQDRIEGDNILQSHIDEEEQRAKDAESTLQHNIDLEHSRAEGAEAYLQEQIDEISGGIERYTYEETMTILNPPRIENNSLNLGYSSSINDDIIDLGEDIEVEDDMLVIQGD